MWIIFESHINKMNRVPGPQILITSASEERLQDNYKVKLIKVFDWIFLMVTICLIWISALTRTCFEKAIFIGSVSTVVVLTLFIIIYKVGKWRFDANKDLENSKVVFDFDKLLPKKRNSVFSQNSLNSGATT